MTLRSVPRTLTFAVCLASCGFGCVAACAAPPLPVEVHEGTSMAFSLSPDRSTIVMDLQGVLFVLPATGGRATAITDELYDAREPTWSPDGHSIAFQSDRDGHWRVWVIGAHGENPHPLTTGLHEERDPSWAPDGESIAFTSERGGKFDVWSLSLRTGTIRQLTTGPGGNSRPTWSPDGRQLAYVSDRDGAAGLYVLDAARVERSLSPVANPGFGMSVPMGTPSWTPDGLHVLFAEIVDGTAQLRLDGRIIATGEDFHPFRAAWLSNEEFLYAADGVIKRRSVHGGVLGTVPFTATLSVRKPDYAVRHYDFDSAGPRAVQGIQRAVLSPDGKSVALTALGGLWLMPLEGRPRRLTPAGPYVVVDPAWSPDGKQIAYASDREGSFDLWTYDIEAGRSRQVTSRSGAEMRPAWSPDGRQLAYVDAYGSYTEVLHVLDLNSGEDREVKEAGTSPGFPAWSGDGTSLMVSTLDEYSATQSYYSGGTNQYLVVPVAGGAARKVRVLAGHSVGNRSGDGPVWSPDGTHIAYQSDSALWVTPVHRDGSVDGAPRRLAGEIATALSWSRDSRWLLAQAGNRLRLFDVPTGNVRSIDVPLTWQPERVRGRMTVVAGLLIDGVQERARPLQDIVIDGERIVSVFPHGERPTEGKVIDASHLSVMPGLIDMHVHLIKEYGSRFGRLLLAYGITSIRSPGNIPGDILEEKEAAASGQRPGPRMFVTGYILDGERTVWEMGTTVGSSEEADRQVSLAARLGYDMIKTYVHTSEPIRAQIVAGAHRLGIPVSSHDIYPAALFGSDSVEHLDGNGCSRGYSSKASQLNIAYEDVVRILTASGMSITPTVSLFTPVAEFAAGVPDSATDPRRALQPAWVRDAPLFTMSGVGGDVMIRNVRADILRLYRAGVNVVVGTDSPFTPMGLNTHNEIEQEVKAGLTPAEALRTATAIPARVLGIDRDVGTLEAGKLADLVFVEGNPLEDVHDMMRVRQVMKGGRLYGLGELVSGMPERAITSEAGHDRDP